MERMLLFKFVSDRLCHPQRIPKGEVPGDPILFKNNLQNTNVKMPWHSAFLRKSSLGMTKLRFRVTVCFLLLCDLNIQAETIQLSLKEAISKSMDHHHDLKKARQNLALARANLDLARANFFPTLEMKTNLGTIHDRKMMVGETASTLTPRDYNQYETQLVLSQPIFSGFKNFYHYQSEKAALIEQEYLLKNKSLEIITQVTELYFSIQLIQKNLEAEKEIYKLEYNED